MTSQKIKVAIITPVLNDWDCFECLLRDIDVSLRGQETSTTVIAIDDGSHSTPSHVDIAAYTSIQAVHVVSLKANQGHQRAIALGLSYVEENLEFDKVVVMDSDGEDKPEDIVALMNHSSAKPLCIIAAQRAQRSEGLAFRLFYFFYKLFFLLLTGKTISFGNFCLIPKEKLKNILYNATIWNNFVATLLKSRVELELVRTNRGKRYFGSSRMNFSSLIAHGLSAIAVFSDIVVTRTFMLITALLVALVSIIIGVVVARLVFDQFIPGYATTVILFSVNILSAAVFTGFMTIILLLSFRTNPSVQPSDVIATHIHEVTVFV